MTTAAVVDRSMTTAAVERDARSPHDRGAVDERG